VTAGGRRGAQGTALGRARWGRLLGPWLVLGVIAAALLAWIWTSAAEQRQDRVVPTLAVVALGSSAGLLWTLVWLLALSRLRWPRRIGWSAVLLLGLGAAASVVRVGGWTGDVVPVVAWRWTAEPGAERGPIEPSSDLPPGRASSDADFPQFQGPHRDGSVPDVGLARDWAANPPRERWRRRVGAGWSGFAVAGDHAVTQEQVGGQELVSCYDLRTGAPRWVRGSAARWEDPIGGPGPRATPSIHDGRVFALGATGILSVLDLATGAVIWCKNVLDDHGAAPPAYGVSASPLVTRRSVIVSVGGSEGRSLVAYDREQGEKIWSAGDGAAAYSSPRVAELAGRTQVLVLNGSGLVGHDVADGRVLWQVPWPEGTERVSQPVVLSGDRVFLSTGYGVGGKLFHVRDAEGSGIAVERLWESTGLKAKFTNVVTRDGLLYGLDDGILACLDGADGRRRWKGGRYGHGQILLVGELLLVLSERGEVVLVEARPDGPRELARLSALAGKTWNHPALAGRLLLVRNDREAACYELAPAGPTAGGDRAP
jgi:outer membrane protein assembly factor BamB